MCYCFVVVLPHVTVLTDYRLVTYWALCVGFVVVVVVVVAPHVTVLTDHRLVTHQILVDIGKQES